MVAFRASPMGTTLLFAKSVPPPLAWDSVTIMNFYTSTRVCLLGPLLFLDAPCPFLGPYCIVLPSPLHRP